MLAKYFVANLAAQLLADVRSEECLVDFLNHHEFFASTFRDHERSARTARDRLVTPARRKLDVLGIVVLPRHDDHILDATTDEKLLAVQEAEITRAQEGPLARLGVA